MIEEFSVESTQKVMPVWESVLRWALFLPVALIAAVAISALVDIAVMLLVPTGKQHIPVSWLISPFFQIAIGAKIIPRGRRIYAICSGIGYLLIVVFGQLYVMSQHPLTLHDRLQTWFGVVGGIVATIYFTKRYSLNPTEEEKAISSEPGRALTLTGAVFGVLATILLGGVYLLSIVQAIQGHNPWYMILITTIPGLGQLLWFGVMWGAHGWLNNYAILVYSAVACYGIAGLAAQMNEKSTTISEE